MKKWVCSVCGYVAEGDRARVKRACCKMPAYVTQSPVQGLVNPVVFASRTDSHTSVRTGSE